MGKMTKYLMPTIYIGIVIVMVISSMFVVSGIKSYISDKPIKNYTLEDVFSNDVLPVIKHETDIIVRPYTSESVKVGRYFYDYESNESKQIDSIIYFENTYMQNNGVDYVSDKDFDVISIMDGEVESIEDNQIYGKVVTIKHNDNLKSVYSNIKDIMFDVGDMIFQSDIIGTSNKSKFNDESMLHFEVYYKGEVIDPENLYTMKVSDFE